MQPPPAMGLDRPKHIHSVIYRATGGLDTILWNPNNVPWNLIRDLMIPDMEGHQGNQEFMISIMTTKVTTDLS